MLADLIDVSSCDSTSNLPLWISPPLIVFGPCTSFDTPPPFHDLESDPVPPYEQTNQNPETLARYLFHYGFSKFKVQPTHPYLHTQLITHYTHSFHSSGF